MKDKAERFDELEKFQERMSELLNSIEEGLDLMDPYSSFETEYDKGRHAVLDSMREEMYDAFRELQGEYDLGR